MTGMRIAEHGVNGLIIGRSSPRSFTEEALPLEVLLTMLEAARMGTVFQQQSAVADGLWAARDGGVEGAAGVPGAGKPKAGARQAAALVVFLARRTMERDGKTVPMRLGGFDTGAAWMSFALQAELLGWSTHGMGGIFRRDGAGHAACASGLRGDGVRGG